MLVYQKLYPLSFLKAKADNKFKYFYPEKVQSVGNSCGAWLIGDMLAYVIGISPSLMSFHRENVFKLIFLFIEDLMLSEIVKRDKKYFRAAKNLNAKV